MRDPNRAILITAWIYGITVISTMAVMWPL